MLHMKRSLSFIGLMALILASCTQGPTDNRTVFEGRIGGLATGTIRTAPDGPATAG